ncbi:MAG TPA: metal-dependent hydrolase [Candidatus Saccharimonadales bacterium]|nr:metal-dependent hydrolase [Candidatus Saccharimonadales bacterium]
MPGYKGHITGAIACNAAYVGAVTATPSSLLNSTHNMVSDLQLLIGLFVIAVLFGLFPDIDTNSKGQNIFYGVALAADIMLILDGRMEAAAFLGLLAMLPVVGKHRGWTHSKPAMLLIPAPIVVIPYFYNPAILDTALLIYGAAVTGYFSHLLFDGMIWKKFRIKGRSYANS